VNCRVPKEVSGVSFFGGDVGMASTQPAEKIKPTNDEHKLTSPRKRRIGLSSFMRNEEEKCSFTSEKQ